MSALREVDSMTARAAAYRLLSVGYAYPADGRLDLVGSLALEVTPAVDAVHPGTSGAFSELGHAAAASDAEGVEADFNRLFSGPVECVPHENAYEPDLFRRQRVMADVAGFYRAFGFELPHASRWQPDHVGVELEFCSVLLQRTALAVDQGWDEPAGIAEEALRGFLLDHLGRWFETFTGLLEHRAQAPVYTALARATRSWVGAELSVLGLQPDVLRRVPASDPSLPTCGGCPATPSGR